MLHVIYYKGWQKNKNGRKLVFGNSVLYWQVVMGGYRSISFTMHKCELEGDQFSSSCSAAFCVNGVEFTLSKLTLCKWMPKQIKSVNCVAICKQWWIFVVYEEGLQEKNLKKWNLFTGMTVWVEHRCLHYARNFWKGEKQLTCTIASLVDDLRLYLPKLC